MASRGSWTVTASAETQGGHGGNDMTRDARKLSGAFVDRNFDLAEPVPDEAWRKLTIIMLERGR